jgi:hypothetical protein
MRRFRLTKEELAACIGVPRGTMFDWLPDPSSDKPPHEIPPGRAAFILSIVRLEVGDGIRSVAVGPDEIAVIVQRPTPNPRSHD